MRDHGLPAVASPAPHSGLITYFVRVWVHSCPPAPLRLTLSSLQSMNWGLWQG